MMVQVEQIHYRLLDELEDQKEEVENPILG
jgi:hypothetical protein